MSVAQEELILHIDVDAFFASVEQLLIPGLRGRPVIVGSGVIASCSYEARASGLHAGMELHRARRLCPGVVILEGNYQIYRCFAQHIWDICRRYTVGMETYLDEAYGDATGMDAFYGGDALAMGRRLQKDVLDEVGLPVSVGLASNRMVAGIASGKVKPRGVAWVKPGEEADFVAPLEVEELPGVGRKTAGQLHDLNIRTVADLRAMPCQTLRAMFGRRGEVLYERCRGRDTPAGIEADAPEEETEEETAGKMPAGREDKMSSPRAGETPASQVAGQRPAPQRMPGSISRQTTFHQAQCDAGQIRGMLYYLLERAMRTARQGGLKVGCVELSICYDDWKSLAAQKALPSPTDVDAEAFAVVLELLGRLHKRRVALRNIGVTLSKFSRRGVQGSLFDAPQEVASEELGQALDAIRDRFGHGALVTGQSIELLGKLKQNDYGFVLRTPSLTK